MKSNKMQVSETRENENRKNRNRKDSHCLSVCGGGINVRTSLLL